MHTVKVTASIPATLKSLSEYGNGNQRRRNTSYYGNGYLASYNSFIEYGGGYHQMPEAFSTQMNSLPGTGSRVKMSIEVTAPGIVEVPNLAENSDGQFRYVFFPEAGRFSLVKIYKFMRSEIGQTWNGVGLSIDRIPGYLEHPRKIKDDAKATKDNNDLTSIMKLEIAKVLPYGVEDEKGLKKLEAFREVQREIKKLSFLKKAKAKAKKVEKTIVAEASANPYADYMVFEGRYIPLITTNGGYSDYYGYHGYKTYYVKADGNLISTENSNAIPGEDKSKGMGNALGTMLQTVGTDLIRQAAPARSTHYTGWYDMIMSILFYDVETSRIVMAPDLARQAHDAMRAALEAGTATYESRLAKLVKNISAAEFIEKANAYMKSRGFVNFSISRALPIHFHDAAEIHNWTNNNHKNYKGEFQPSFNIEVRYDGKELIGTKAGSHYGRGHLIAELNDDGKVIMVQSAWCQRVSKWTKQHRIDQKNRDWFLDDWLAGPNAERMGLNIKEAPIVYYGNKGKKKDRKAAILKKMRNLQNNL